MGYLLGRFLWRRILGLSMRAFEGWGYLGEGGKGVEDLEGEAGIFALYASGEGESILTGCVHNVLKFRWTD